MAITGGCHCGAVRYEAEGPLTHAALCHCTDCRRVSGAPAMAWASARCADFGYTAKQPLRYASSAKVTRAFCGDCGAQLTYAHDDYGGERIDIAISTLDDPDIAPPQAQIFVSSRLSWMADLGALPERAPDVSPSSGQ